MNFEMYFSIAGPEQYFSTINETVASFPVSCHLIDIELYFPAADTVGLTKFKSHWIFKSR